MDTKSLQALSWAQLEELKQQIVQVQKEMSTPIRRPPPPPTPQELFHRAFFERNATGVRDALTAGADPNAKVESIQRCCVSIYYALCPHEWGQWDDKVYGSDLYNHLTHKWRSPEDRKKHMDLFQALLEDPKINLDTPMDIFVDSKSQWGKQEKRRVTVLEALVRQGGDNELVMESVQKMVKQGCKVTTEAHIAAGIDSRCLKALGCNRPHPEFPPPGVPKEGLQKWTWEDTDAPIIRCHAEFEYKRK